jgi:hypothetical protein
MAPMAKIPPSRVVALVRDLIFASKISAAGKAAGVEVILLRDSAQLAEQAAALLLVDLNQPGAIEAASKWRESTGSEVIGFVSHVDVETIRQAKASGIEKVMARSGFVQMLSDFLR